MVFSYRNSIIHVFFMMEMGVGILFKKEMWDFMKELMVVSFVVIGLIAFRISRMYMESVCMAEAIFRTFGWPEVEKSICERLPRRTQGNIKFLVSANVIFVITSR